MSGLKMHYWIGKHGIFTNSLFRDKHTFDYTKRLKYMGWSKDKHYPIKLNTGRVLYKEVTVNAKNK
jgi:hypothetical protein